MERKFFTPGCYLGSWMHPKHITQELFRKNPVQLEMEYYQERKSGSLQANASLLARKIAKCLIACFYL